MAKSEDNVPVANNNEKPESKLDSDIQTFKLACSDGERCFAWRATLNRKQKLLRFSSPSEISRKEFMSGKIYI